MYTTGSWEVWGTISLYKIPNRCAVGTPLHFKKFLERQRTSRILEDSIFIFLSHEYYFKIFKTFPASAFGQGHSTKFSSIQQPYFRNFLESTRSWSRGMRLVDSNPNRFTYSNSESMIEFHAYDIESRRLSSP